MSNFFAVCLRYEKCPELPFPDRVCVWIQSTSFRPRGKLQYLSGELVKPIRGKLLPGSEECGMWIKFAERQAHAWNVLLGVEKITGLSRLTPPGILADRLDDIGKEPLAQQVRFHFGLLTVKRPLHDNPIPFDLDCPALPDFGEDPRLQ